MIAAAAAVSSTREKAPKAAVVATPKNAASRRSAVAPSNTSRASGVTAGSARSCGAKLGVGIKRVGDDDFARLDAGDLGRKTGTVAFRHAKLARGDVDPGEREAVLRRGGAGAREREQVVVAPGIEQRILGQRAGGDQPHHVAAHDALVAALSRLGGIFKLLADGDTMAERDQPVQVFVGALDRNAAHRNVAAQMLAALGEHDAKRARGDFGVIEEQFVEITHPVEQETIRIGRLDLDVLLHHRGDRLSRRVWSFAAPCGIALQHR